MSYTATINATNLGCSLTCKDLARGVTKGDRRVARHCGCARRAMASSIPPKMRPCNG
jgi:hypothetical protein